MPTDYYEKYGVTKTNQYGSTSQDYSRDNLDGLMNEIRETNETLRKILSELIYTNSRMR